MIDDRSHEALIDTNRQEAIASPNDSAGQAMRARPRRRTLLALVVAIFFSMGHLAGAYQKEKELNELKAKTITSERFELRGADNKLKASLYKGRESEVYLAFFDDAGKPRLNLGLSDKGSPVISFFSDESAQRMSLALNSNDGTPQVILYDEHNAPAVQVGVVQGFGPHLTIGKDGHSQITAFLTADGSPSFQMLDEKRKPRLALGVTRNEPSFALMGDDGVARAMWRVSPDGSASLTFSGSQAQQRLVVATDKEGRPSIRFIGKDNAVVREFK